MASVTSVISTVREDKQVPYPSTALLRFSLCLRGSVVNMLAREFLNNDPTAPHCAAPATTNPPFSRALTLSIEAK